MTYPYKNRPKTEKRIKKPIKKRVVIDQPRMYWLLGMLMSKYRRHITLTDLAAMLGIRPRTMRHVAEGRLPLGAPTLNRIVAFMRSEGFAVHPSDFLEDVLPSQTEK